MDGDRLLAQSDRVRFDPRTGQMVLALDSGGLEEAATATLSTGLVRPLAPPADQAETWFERASEWDGDPAQWEDAIVAYRRVVAIDPTYAAAWNNLGLLLHRMGRYDEAEGAYASALEQDPNCCEAAYNLGSLHEDRGAPEDAILDYRRALGLSPDYADAHFNLAGALARNGRDGEAIKHWQRYLELDSGSPWARIARAHLDGVEPPGDEGPSDEESCSWAAEVASTRSPGRSPRARWSTRCSRRPGNPGIARHASCVDIGVDAPTTSWRSRGASGVDLIVVGPEIPLVAGFADRLPMPV